MLFALPPSLHPFHLFLPGTFFFNPWEIARVAQGFSIYSGLFMKFMTSHAKGLHIRYPSAQKGENTQNLWTNSFMETAKHNKSDQRCFCKPLLRIIRLVMIDSMNRIAKKSSLNDDCRFGLTWPIMLEAEGETTTLTGTF